MCILRSQTKFWGESKKRSGKHCVTLKWSHFHSNKQTCFVVSSRYLTINREDTRKLTTLEKVSSGGVVIINSPGSEAGSRFRLFRCWNMLARRCPPECALYLLLCVSPSESICLPGHTPNALFCRSEGPKFPDNFATGPLQWCERKRRVILRNEVRTCPRKVFLWLGARWQKRLLKIPIASGRSRKKKHWQINGKN